MHCTIAWLTDLMVFCTGGLRKATIGWTTIRERQATPTSWCIPTENTPPVCPRTMPKPTRAQRMPITIIAMWPCVCVCVRVSMSMCILNPKLPNLFNLTFIAHWQAGNRAWEQGHVHVHVHVFNQHVRTMSCTCMYIHTCSPRSWRHRLAVSTHVHMHVHYWGGHMHIIYMARCSKGHDTRLLPFTSQGNFCSMHVKRTLNQLELKTIL